MAKVIAKVAAFLLCGSLGSLLVPGCVIRIGPGTGEDTSTDPTSAEGEPDGTDDPNEDGMTPEEQAALEAFESVDPDEFRLKTAATVYAASACASLVESQIPDPDAVDLETVSALLSSMHPLLLTKPWCGWTRSILPPSLSTSSPTFRAGMIPTAARTR